MEGFEGDHMLYAHGFDQGYLQEQATKVMDALGLVPYDITLLARTHSVIEEVDHRYLINGNIWAGTRFVALGEGSDPETLFWAGAYTVFLNEGCGLTPEDSVRRARERFGIPPPMDLPPP